MLGQNYSLICNVTVTGADTGDPSITYQWTKDNGTQTLGTDRVLSFSPLRLSDAGQYTCQATVSPCSIIEMDTQNVILQSEFNRTELAIEGFFVSMIPSKCNFFRILHEA